MNIKFKNSVQWKLMGLLALSVLVSTGCTFKAFSSPSNVLTGNPLAGFNQEEESAEQPISSESYSIAVNDSWGKAKVVKSPFVRSISLSEALEQQGLTKRFTDMEVTLVRVDKVSGKIVKMKAEYDSTANRIAIQNDYDVKANDHIIVKPKSNTPLDDFTQPLNDLVKRYDG